MTTKKTTKPKRATKKVAKKATSNTKLSVDVYTKEGKKKGSVDLPASVFGVAWNGSLIQQVVVGMQANARTPVAHAKTRGEVRGGGRKPWKQKGTGRARHGSIRSPIWVGGGVTHGPRNDKVYAKKINKKMRVKALYIALSQKAKEGSVIFIDELAFTAPKSSEAKKMLYALSKVTGFEMLATKNKNAALVVLPGKDVSASKSFANFGNVSTTEVKDINPVVVLKHKYVIIGNPESAFKILQSRGGK
jgi:large subunit ribosomal protein L4